MLHSFKKVSNLIEENGVQKRVKPTTSWLEIWRSTAMLWYKILVKKLYLTEEAMPKKIMPPCQLSHAARSIVSPPQF